MISITLVNIVDAAIPELDAGKTLFAEEAEKNSCVIISATTNDPDSGYNSMKAVTQTATVQVRVFPQNKEKAAGFTTAQQVADALTAITSEEHDGYYIYQAAHTNGPVWINASVGFWSMNFVVRYRVV